MVRAGLDRPQQGSAAVRTDGGEAFRQFSGQCAQIDRGEESPGLAAFDFGDAQDRGEQRQHLVDPHDRIFEHGRVDVRPSMLDAPCSSRLRRRGKRRAQVVGNVAGDLAQIFEQSFDSIEHAVERRSELVELVARGR